mmetsp:Transcript_97946/g.281771  ORF Transcript_97946/g.281771 Transcript_97946/m.281771 type:complete len:584 (-) Transcript_97946:217-1968(-)
MAWRDLESCTNGAAVAKCAAPSAARSGGVGGTTTAALRRRAAPILGAVVAVLGVGVAVRLASHALHGFVAVAALTALLIAAALLRASGRRRGVRRGAPQLVPLASVPRRKGSKNSRSTIPRANTTSCLGQDDGSLAKRAGRQPKKVHFNNRVVCSYLRPVPPELKADVWWQQEDFDAFLNIRVEIGKAYRAAAKKLGLDIMQVSSVGSHGDEGYRAMIKINSKLCGESRRGLGLGRKRARAKNRDAYIAAVLYEQRRQRRVYQQLHGEASSMSADSDVEGQDNSPNPDGFVLDVDALAVAARRVSEKDRLYAHFLAVSYYEQDREVERNEAREMELRAAEQLACGAPADTGGSPAVVSPVQSKPCLPSSLKDASTPPVPETPPSSLKVHSASDRKARRRKKKNRRATVPSAPNFDSTPGTLSEDLSSSSDREDGGRSSESNSLSEEDLPLDTVMDRRCSPVNSSSSKGFGLSRDRLREVGLSATGHSITRYQTLRRLKQSSVPPLTDESESDKTGCESEDDMPQSCIDDDEQAAVIQEYRKWRRGAPVRAGLRGFSEVKTYGTRKEYRAWRSWQKPAAEPDDA